MVLDLRIWVTCTLLLTQIWVSILKVCKPTGMDPGHPRVHSCSPLFNYDPVSDRYIKKHILYGAIIPGPNKPKIIESFLFPGLHHLSAIQKEGLPIWDASRDVLYISHLRVNTSAPVGDPDPYLLVYILSKLKPRPVWVIRCRWPGSAGQVPVKIQVLVI